MEKYAFFLMILLSFGIALSAIKEGRFVTKARWIQGLFTVFTISIFALWFFLQSEKNIESNSIISKNAQEFSRKMEKTFILGSNQDRSRLSTIKFSIFTSLNFLLLFLNIILMIRNVKLERKVIA